MKRLYLAFVTGLIASLIIVLCVAPGRATTVPPGSGRVFGPATVAGHTCVLSDLHYAQPGASRVVWFVDSTQTATLTVLREDIAGIDHSQSASSQSITANVESQQILNYRLALSRINICNTTGSNSTITLDVDESL